MHEIPDQRMSPYQNLQKTKPDGAASSRVGLTRKLASKKAEKDFVVVVNWQRSGAGSSEATEEIESIKFPQSILLSPHFVNPYPLSVNGKSKCHSFRELKVSYLGAFVVWRWGGQWPFAKGGLVLECGLFVHVELTAGPTVVLFSLDVRGG